MQRMDADVVVIGSGFGGSVCAFRGAEAGRRIIVLERGHRMTPQRFADLAAGREPIVHGEFRPGLVDRPKVRGLVAIVGNAVGGGSHAYTAVTVPPRPEIFERNWPAGWTAATLAPCIERVRSVIAPTPTPHALPRTKRLEQAAAIMGVHAIRLPVAIDWPANPADMAARPADASIRGRLSTWLQGGGVATKRTLDKTYLARAEQCGAQIRPLHEVTGIRPEHGGYRVFYDRLVAGDRDAGSITARHVVLAAGTLATNRLLFACRESGILPHIGEALGQRFFTNGDLGALIVGLDGELTADCGPPVTAWLDLWEQDRLYLMELGIVPGLPPVLGHMLRFLGTATHRTARGAATPGTEAWVIGVMGFDETPGRLVSTRDGALAYERDEPGLPRQHDAAMRRLGELADALGASLLAVPSAVLARTSFTVHPLGGAAMADSPACGVANPRGEVFNYPGLFIADGSLLPTPIGCAPSMTIAALAEHVAAEMLKT